MKRFSQIIKDFITSTYYVCPYPCAHDLYRDPCCGDFYCDRFYDHFYGHFCDDRWYCRASHVYLYDPCHQSGACHDRDLFRDPFYGFSYDGDEKNGDDGFFRDL